MAWNEPGNNDNKDPWGNRKKQDGPPDLDELLKKLTGFFGGGSGKGGKKGSGGGGRIVVATMKTLFRQSLRLLMLVGRLVIDRVLPRDIPSPL